MREILFKAKRLDNGEWVEGFVFWMFYDGIKICCIGCEPIQTNDYGEIISDWCAVDEDTLCQYIGLKDKNEVKIFEGDIIKHYTGCPIDEYSIDTGNVFWHNPIQRYLRTSSIIKSDCKELSAKCKYKVIGNIHDKEE